jgi:homoserine kinase
VVAIPDFELSTAEARKVLPADYNKADAIFNAAHLGLLVRALAAGDRELAALRPPRQNSPTLPAISDSGI